MWRYCHTKGADGDLQSILHHTLSTMRRDSAFDYSSEWVRSHQDNATDLRSLLREVALNVRMDRDTKAAYQLPAQSQSIDFVPVLKAEGCAVYLGDRKLTSHIHMNVLEQWHEREAKDYLSRRHGFDKDTIQSTCWQSLRYSLRKLSPHRGATAVKAIHRPLPTQEKSFKQGRVTMCSTCPRCVLTAETNARVYCCLNDDAVKHRKEDWMEVWKLLSKCHTAPIIEHTWRHYLHPLVAIPIGNSLYAGIPITHGTSQQSPLSYLRTNSRRLG